MSVEMLLSKVQAHNVGVRACILSSGDALYHTLSGNYEVIDPRDFVDLADHMLVLADAAPELEDGSDTAFIEYESHSVYMRRVGDGVLIVLTDPMNMVGFKKISVGINLFLKPLMKALAETKIPAAAEQRPAAASPMVLRADAPIVKNRTAAAEAPAAEPEPETPRYARSEGEAEAPGKKKKQRFYRGVAY